VDQKRSNGATFNYAGGISKRDALSPPNNLSEQALQMGFSPNGKYLAVATGTRTLTQHTRIWMCRQKHGVPVWTALDDELISHLIVPDSWLEPRFGIFVQTRP
jgi:hypothetical protein